MQDFLLKIESIVRLTEDAKRMLLDISFIKFYEKGEFILSEGMVCNSLYYTEKGLARIYYYKNGREVTEWIGLEHNFFFSILSFFERTPSRLIIECLEPSEIVHISRDRFLALSDADLEIARLLRKLLTTSLILSQKRMESIQFETALERYKKLLQESPEMIRRVPLMYIASFLGISFETLSRIRAQVH